jgi:serine/threonine-protein kinase
LIRVSQPKLLEIGTDGPLRIDRYDLVAEIASGGMASVYLGRLSGVGGFRRLFAIKRLHPHLAREEEFVEMFLDEARLAAGIHHPNVVAILEVGASDVGYYLVMEYVEGDTLASLLQRAANRGSVLAPKVAIRIVIDMLRGLHAAHELRDEQGNVTELVHRDVSPQNILVGGDGVTRITDFGVAHAASRLSSTRAGQLKGKIAYMAPEQASSEPQIDRRADIFSAGIVLWEALAARRLFKAANDAATLSRVVSEEIVHPVTINENLDQAICDVCMKALARDIEARYRTAAEFADALEDAANRASLLASTREVAEFVADVMGDELIQQREAVRSWAAKSELSLPGKDYSPASSATSGVSLVPSTTEQVEEVSLSSIVEQPAKSRFKKAWGIAALLGVVAIGVIIFTQTRAPLPASSDAMAQTPPAPEQKTQMSATSNKPTPPKPPDPVAVVALPTPQPAPVASASPPPESKPASKQEQAETRKTAESPKASKESEPRAAKKPKGKPETPAAAADSKPKVAVDLSNPYR